ncbi:MAG: PepSY-associated TM helix domain-containing protein [Bacteroidota bacterium]
MKKLKGLRDRAYHVMFHTHTVAGIVISFALFVIFYAGAFSLFKHELAQWENQTLRQGYQEDFPIEKGLRKVDSLYAIDRDQQLFIKLPTELNPLITISGTSQKTTADSTGNDFFQVHIGPSLEVIHKDDSQTTVGTTLYHLHYFRQLGLAGQFISGLIGLFFLFAIISGVLIHWTKLLTRFYAFIKEGAWKTIWTNAHTVLGILGLPFQIMYAVTGAFFGIVAIAFLPYLIFGDFDLNEAEKEISIYKKIQLDENASDYEHLDIGTLYQKVKEAYPSFTVKSVVMNHYGKEDAIANWYIEDYKGVSSRGTIAMYMKDGIILDEYTVFPYEKSYIQHVYNYSHALHFGTFGGYLIRVLFFILSLLTCFMIISGVMIWRTARDNKKYTLKQRRFHHNVTKWYLAICLSMFPAFAILFVANKLVPMAMTNRIDMVNSIFFLSWLGLTIYGIFPSNYSKQNRNYLVIGGLLSLLVPITNGALTGDWIWVAWTPYPWVAYVDIFWLTTGILSLYASFFLLKVKDTSDIPVELVNVHRTAKVIEPEETRVLKPQVR